MKKLTCALVALTLVAWASAADAAEGKVRVLLTYGGHGFDEQPFFAMFDAMQDVEHTKAELPKDADLLKPGLEKQYDVIVMYDMSGGLTPEQRENFARLVKQGIGVVSLHHNLGAHRDWDEWRKIIGGKYVFEPSEYEGQKYEVTPWEHDNDLHVTVTDAGKLHPITEGLSEFDIHDETYGRYFVTKDATVLLKTDHPKNNPALAWVTKYGNSRVFYLQLGHDAKAYENPNFPKLVHRGIHWAAGKR